MNPHRVAEDAPPRPAETRRPQRAASTFLKANRLFLPMLLLGLMYSSVAAQPYGLTQREPNTTLQMPQQPATYGYMLTNAFPGLAFTNPIAFATPPGETNRLFIVERPGRIIVITNLSAPTRSVYLDITSRVLLGCEEGLLGLAFHPGYSTNGYFFVFYTVNATTSSTGRHQRISRFRVSTGNPHVADPNSELPLITQFDEACNHNGGDIHFGPDGYLYIAVGDEGGQNDFYNNSQRIDRDFFAGILRIDVDQRPGNLPPRPHPALMGVTNYFIPADNPFVGATQLNGTNINTNALRAEFWAIGLRNPWRFSFDTDGTLYCGDVGGSAREEVNVILRGGNYGWVWREGTLLGPVSTNRGPAGFSQFAPILEYAHGTATNQGNSITGGRVYRGTRIAQLFGQYVFSDYSSGNIWALTPNGTNAVPFRRLLGQGGIVAFGADPRNGDLLLANLSGNNVLRLIYNTNSSSGTALPATLAATGVFADLLTLTPQPGIVPYDINVPFWSDHARKTRWFSVPNTNQTITFNGSGNWGFPTGTVWIKHFEIELTNGVPSSTRRLETRLLVRNASGVYGVTYRWGTSMTNATLVGEEGLDETLVINNGGVLRTQVWRYPSRAECLSCHSTVAGGALGFGTAQLNRDFDYNGTVDNQIRTLSHVGYFSSPITDLHTLPRLASAGDADWSLEYRVRSYLAANCAQCHQPGGAALGFWDARITNPLSASGLIHGALNNPLGDTNNRVVVPGNLSRSVLLTRITATNNLRMPPLASTVVDTQAVALLSAWITNGLAGYQTFAQWQIAHFGSTNAANGGPVQDFDADGSANYQEYLLGTVPTNAASSWRISASASNGAALIQFPRIANRGFEVQVMTNPAAPSWQPLNRPANRPFFAATNSTATVDDPLDTAPRFYRVRTYEP